MGERIAKYRDHAVALVGSAAVYAAALAADIGDAAIGVGGVIITVGAYLGGKRRGCSDS